MEGLVTTYYLHIVSGTGIGLHIVSGTGIDYVNYLSLNKQLQWEPKNNVTCSSRMDFFFHFKK